MNRREVVGLVVAPASIFLASVYYVWRGYIDIGQAIQIYLAATLVMVTMWYATHAKNSVEEMRKQRVDSVRPILAIESKDFQLYIVENHTIQLRPVRIVNVGLGPAMNVRCTVQYPDHEFDAAEWTVIGVGGEPKQHGFATVFLRGGKRLQDCSGAVMLEYSDVFGNKTLSRVSFKADEQKPSITHRSPLEIGGGMRLPETSRPAKTGGRCSNKGGGNRGRLWPL